MVAPVKPPFSVPSMSEIASIEPNGFRVASTFAGCGGSSLGYRMAGFKVIYANEFVEKAAECYALNAEPHTIIDKTDLRKVDGAKLLKRLDLKVGELDLLDGSPPCASFSMSGKRAEGWGKVRNYSDRAQRVDDLFFVYTKLIGSLRPKVFVAENVAGLPRGASRGIFLDVLEAMRALDYQVEARLLDAQWLGVPQLRSRVIFIGVRGDLDVKPVFPKPAPFRYSVRDAIPWIESASPWPVEADTAISKYAIGDEWEKIGPGEESAKYFNLKRSAIEGPCWTIIAEGGRKSKASVTHPIEKRKFSIAELKRICAFPDDFKLAGSYGDQWERLGRAVPPVMMASIATTIRDEVLAKMKDRRPVKAAVSRRKRSNASS